MAETNSELFRVSRAQWMVWLNQALQYGVALLSVAVALGTTLLFSPYLDPTLTPPFFAAVMVSAWYGGLGPGLLATALSTIVINYLLVQQTDLLSLSHLGSLTRLSVFVMAAILINSLNQSQRIAKRRAEANFRSLRESETRFSCLADSNVIGILVADLNGPILEANDTFLQMVGYTQEELRSGRLHWREMTAPDSLEASERAVQELTTTGACTPFEKAYICKDGSYVPVLHGAAMTGETTLIGFALDLSDRKRNEAQRKRTEEALRESEARFQVLVSNMPGMVYRYRPSGGAVDGAHVFTYVSSGSRDLIELEPETILQDANALLSLIHPNDLPSLKSSVAIAIEQSSSWQWEGRLITPSGQLKWIQGRSRPEATAEGSVWDGLLLDITARKQAEASLQQSEKRYRAVYDQVLIGISQADLTGKFISANERFCEITGRSQEELLSMRMQDLTHPDDLPHNLGLFQQLTQEGTGFEIEKRYICPDGSLVWVRNYVSLIRSADGQPQCTVAVTEDITERKQAEQQLQQTNRTLTTLIESSPLPLIVIAPDATVQLWNPAAEKLFGWSEAEVSGQPLPCIPADKQEECRQFREAVVKGEVFFNVETYRCRRDGSTVIVNISAAPLHTDQGQVNAILLILQDITERQQAEAALRDSEERLRLALVAANQGLYDLNLQTGDAIVSPEYAQMLGYDPDEFQETNAKWRDRMHPDDQATVYRTYEEYVAGRCDEYRVEFRQRTQSGEWKWILSIGKIVSWGSDGQPLRMLGTHTDITHRKQSEDALRQSEERLRLALDAGRMGAWEWNLETNVQRWDVNQYQLFGMDKDKSELSTDTFFQFIHPDDLPSAQQLTQQVLEQGGSFHTEFRVIRPDGSIRWLSSQGMVVQDLAQKPIRLIGVNFDITERKRAEVEREQLLAREQAAREQAEAANRTKDEFLAVLSHELRSPLNPILGWAKLLRSGRLDAQKTAHALETIERNASLQTQLIGDLLDVSRILQGKLSLAVAPVNLTNTIAAAIETVRLAAEAKSIQIQTTFDESVGSVAGDSSRLQQIIWNLLSNAVKFTPDGGQIHVRLEQIDAQAQITVRDTGKGISPEFLPYVFDYFRQADAAITRRFGGLGLGLAIVRHLTELHGGNVTAASLGEGEGATFTVWLPLMRADAELENQPHANASAELLTYSLVGLHILLVDDDDDTREYVNFVLEQAGATVVLASSADEALQRFVQSPPDLLLSDIGMPETDGYTLVRRVRAMPPEQGGQVPAIALTAYAGETNQQQAIAAGFQGHIAKPVAPEILIQEIRKLTARE